MPGLDFCLLERRIKPNFHDLVLGAQYPFSHRLDPALSLRMDVHFQFRPRSADGPRRRHRHLSGSGRGDRGRRRQLGIC